MKKTIFIFYIFISIFSFAQKQGNIWYFGDHAGLDFNSGSPIALTNGEIYDGSDQSEGTSVISDSSGALLFYTNGQKIWNRNHIIMPNGDSLLGNYSSTQAALIIPQPGSSRYFYVFTTDAFQHNLENGFRYSIVDICLDNGLGDVIQNKKNIKLLDTVAEKLTAVRCNNGIDYWVIVHKYLSDAFYAFQLGSNGIIDTVVTHIGSIHQGYCGNPSSSINAMGSMKASPNGSKLAIVSAQQCNNISELFDFNKTTGVLSNLIKLRTDSVAIGLYGVSFSPNNSKLYITSWINHDRIYQYDLTSGNSTTITNSKSVITFHNGGPWYMAMQLGSDGKLYIAERGQSYMGVINFPDLNGVSCNYQDSAVSLNGKTNVLGLPNFIDLFDYSNTTYGCLTGIEEQLLSKNFTLLNQNVPNPFTEQTTIFFNEEAKNTTLKITDVLGKEIKSVAIPNGTKEFVFKRENLANGVYFYTIISENKNVASGKLVIQ